MGIEFARLPATPTSLFVGSSHRALSRLPLPCPSGVVTASESQAQKSARFHARRRVPASSGTAAAGGDSCIALAACLCAQGWPCSARYSRSPERNALVRTNALLHYLLRAVGQSTVNVPSSQFANLASLDNSGKLDPVGVVSRRTGSVNWEVFFWTEE